MSLKCTMILGDCLDVMPKLAKDSVNMTFCDLPYGATGAAWDIPICPKKLRDALVPIDRGPIVLTGNEKFHLRMIDAWRDIYRYALIWEKNAPCNFLQARYRPLVSHEYVGIYGPTPTYNPQKTYGHKPFKKTYGPVTFSFTRGFLRRTPGTRHDSDDSRFPRSILHFKHDKRSRHKNTDDGAKRRKKVNPSRKPVALLDWFIRTYSNPGDNVLDPVSGSGTTAVAGLLAGRNVTCIERDEGYFVASVARIEKTICDNNLDVALEVRR